MTYSKTQNKRRTVCRRAVLLLAALSLVLCLLGLPLYAQTVALNSPAGRMVDDVKNGARDLGRGVRDFGRDVRDAVDPDGDGILPDGSVDNGIANDGNQFDNENGNGHGNMTGNVSENVTGMIPDTPESSGMLDEVRPDVTGEPSHPSPDDNNGNAGGMTGDMTDNAQNGTSNGTDATDKPTTNNNGNAGNNGNADNNGNANNNDNTDEKTEGGFRWTGLIIALIIAAAVIAVICLLIPKKKIK